MLRREVDAVVDKEGKLTMCQLEQKQNSYQYWYEETWFFYNVAQMDAQKCFH